MGIKYIRNTDDATIVCKIPSDKNRSFVFRARKLDKRNNVLISNGFTESSDEEITLLRKESTTFQFYEKSGKLTVVDSLPMDAMSSDQLVATLKNENASLKKQLSEALKSSDQGALQNALIKIEEQEKALQEAAEKIEAQEKMIMGLDEQLAMMAGELHAADAEEKE